MDGIVFMLHAVIGYRWPFASPRWAHNLNQLLIKIEWISILSRGQCVLGCYSDGNDWCRQFGQYVYDRLTSSISVIITHGEAFQIQCYMNWFISSLSKQNSIDNINWMIMDTSECVFHNISRLSQNAKIKKKTIWLKTESLVPLNLNVDHLHRSLHSNKSIIRCRH